MSNVDNEGLRTLDEVRQARSGQHQYPTGQRLNPGEIEEIEAAARRGAMLPPNDTLALVNTITALSSRITRRFNETAEARQEAAQSRELANRFRLELKDARVQIANLDRVLKVWERGEWLEAGAVRERIAELEAQVGEYQKDATERTKVVDEIRSRFEIKPGEDLYKGLCRRVGDLQTSEAELVSAPLMARAERAEAKVEEMEAQLRHVEQVAATARNRKDAAEHRAARVSRRLEEAEQHTARMTIELNEAYELVRQLEAQTHLLKVAVDDWKQEKTDKSLEEIRDRHTGYLVLANVVNGVRKALIQRVGGKN